MKVQVDNRVVEMVLVPSYEHQSNKVVYHEANDNGQHVTEHSFASDPFSVDAGEGVGFWTNGHHYRTGALVGESCDSPECTRCPK
jgi:hypothetical protein